MIGRDPDEPVRSATPLELLYDLTFVIAFGAAASEFAHYLAEGHLWSGLGGFVFTVFAVSWAWINYSWFASAFDNDDWLFRLATFVQMIGVIILTLGIPRVFESLDNGEQLDNGTLVAGYVVMRVALVGLWIRVAVTNPERRRAAISYAVIVGVAQLGWIATAIADIDPLVMLVFAVLLFLLEFAGPVIGELYKGGTPWHPGHIAERYGLLVIITLGEVILGTVTTISAIVVEHGWTAEAIMLAFSGTALAFGIWWVYFALPGRIAFRRARWRTFVWAYGSIVVFAAIAAIGAGLHVAALAIEGESTLTSFQVILTIAVPLLVLWIAIFVLYSIVIRTFDPFHVPAFAASVLAMLAACAAVALGASVAVGVTIMVLSPTVIIVAFETVAYRHEQQAIERLLAKEGHPPSES